VYYDDRFYIGRVLAKEKKTVKMKFLREVFPDVYNWPSTTNIEDVEFHFIFCGPLHLEGHGPFNIDSNSEAVKNKYRDIKKRN
jgi:hypothetical protein